MAGKAALVEAVNASSKDDRTSTQRDDQLAANSTDHPLLYNYTIASRLLRLIQLAIQ